MSELKRAHGMGKLRVRRLPQVRFSVASKVAACNIKRWLRAMATSAHPILGPLIAIFGAFLTALSQFQLQYCPVPQSIEFRLGS